MPPVAFKALRHSLKRINSITNTDSGAAISPPKGGNINVPATPGYQGYQDRKP